MSAGEEQPAEPEAVEEEPAGEPGEMSERTARAILVVVACGAMWGLVAAFPWVAYVVVGIVGTLGWQRARDWIVRRREGEPDSEEQEEREHVDVGAALRRLIGDDKGVLLTVLRDDLRLPDTKAVKALLEAENIPWKASRTRLGNGPAVRAEAIPGAPSSPTGHTHGDRCCCTSGDNNNNNSSGEGSGEGFRVDRTDTGFTIHDLSRRAGARQGDADDDVIARFLAEVARAQAKPSGPPAV